MDKYCSFGTSTGNASTMRRASWEFHWFSTASVSYTHLANALPVSVTSPGRDAAISSVKKRLSVRG